MAARVQPTGGMAIMLKALGVNPEIFTQVAGAVMEIATRLERIEQKLDALKKEIDGRKPN